MNTNEPQILMTRKHLAKADHVSSTGITQRPRSESPQNNIRGFPRFIQWSVHFTQIALYRLGVLHDSREPLPTFAAAASLDLPNDQSCQSKAIDPFSRGRVYSLEVGASVNALTR
jgi:hypothetical protein